MTNTEFIVTAAICSLVLYYGARIYNYFHNRGQK